jgi:hypothetical protein
MSNKEETQMNKATRNEVDIELEALYRQIDRETNSLQMHDACNMVSDKDYEIAWCKLRDFEVREIEKILFRHGWTHEEYFKEQ